MVSACNVYFFLGLPMHYFIALATLEEAKMSLLSMSINGSLIYLSFIYTQLKVSPTWLLFGLCRFLTRTIIKLLIRSVQRYLAVDIFKSVLLSVSLFELCSLNVEAYNDCRSMIGKFDLIVLNNSRNLQLLTKKSGVKI